MEVVLCPKAPPKTTITWSFLSSVQVQGSVDVDMYKYTYIRMYLLWYVYKICNIYIDGLRKAGDAPGHKIVIAVCVCVFVVVIVFIPSRCSCCCCCCRCRC